MEKQEYKITPKGSLGLLALGDLGFEAWQKVKAETEHEPTYTLLTEPNANENEK